MPETQIKRDLVLLFVSYHTPIREVDKLEACLALLPENIGFAVVVNDHRFGEPIERLSKKADCFLLNSDNPGYGVAANRLVSELKDLPNYIGILNTDLSWKPGTFNTLFRWLSLNKGVVLAVPQIVNPSGEIQFLCKQNPTVLGLFSRRFIPERVKPEFLRRYDKWYVMAHRNYQEPFEVDYLSGCCMLIRTDAFVKIGGFDSGFFLYLEDADITRSLAKEGRCIHLPIASVIHNWGKGNYARIGLIIVNLASAWHYFWKWGWSLW